eukprot:scaffold118750_cov32-Tisochrysis_lutea.AAC.2
MSILHIRTLVCDQNRTSPRMLATRMLILHHPYGSRQSINVSAAKHRRNCALGEKSPWAQRQHQSCSDSKHKGAPVITASRVSHAGRARNSLVRLLTFTALAHAREWKRG